MKEPDSKRFERPQERAVSAIAWACCVAIVAVMVYVFAASIWGGKP